jgi:hypothetical protein
LLDPVLSDAIGFRGCALSNAKRVGKLHRMGEPGQQVDLPCRYCKELTPFGKEQLEDCLSLSAMTIETRGERPIDPAEIAVCASCRPRYLEENCPTTVYVDEKVTDEDWAKPDAGDGFGPEDSQGDIPFE